MAAAYNKLLSEVGPSNMCADASHQRVLWPSALPVDRFLAMMRVHMEAGGAFPETASVESALRPVQVNIQSEHADTTRLKSQHRFQSVISMAAVMRKLQRSTVNLALLWSSAENETAASDEPFFAKSLFQELVRCERLLGEARALQSCAPNAISSLRDITEPAHDKDVAESMLPVVVNFAGFLEQVHQVLSMIAASASKRLVTWLDERIQQLEATFVQNYITWMVDARDRDAIMTNMEQNKKLHKQIAPGHAKLSIDVATVNVYNVKPIRVDSVVSRGEALVAHSERYLALAAAIHTLVCKAEKPEKYFPHIR